LAGKLKSLARKKNLRLIINNNYVESVSNVPLNAVNTVDNQALCIELGFDYIGHICGVEIPHEQKICCEINGVYGYEHLEYVEFYRKQNKVKLTADINFRFSDWDESINILSFTELLREKILMDYSITSKQENLFEEDLINIQFNISGDENTSIRKILESFEDKIILTHENILSYYQNYVTLSKEFYLPANYKQAGSLLLSYLSSILLARLPRAEISVSVTQNPLTSIIDLVFHKEWKNEVTTIIQNYGFLLLEQQKPEQFFCEKSQCAAFKHRIEMVKNEIHYAQSTWCKADKSPRESLYPVNVELERISSIIGNVLLHLNPFSRQDTTPE
jgi:hypothetical protein